MSMAIFPLLSTADFKYVALVLAERQLCQRAGRPRQRLDLAFALGGQARRGSGQLYCPQDGQHGLGGQRGLLWISHLPPPQ